MDNDLLNLLYVQNFLEKNFPKKSSKVTNKLTERVKVNDIIMQGSVWRSLKCTAVMDKLVTKNPALQYSYKNDPNITLGVNGIVDDILAISEGGKNSIVKNAVINSFIESERLQGQK